MKTNQILGLLFLLGVFFQSCHSTGWDKINTYSVEQPAPASIRKIFDSHDNGTINIRAKSPAYAYKYDIGEKDEYYGKDSSSFSFNKISIKLRDKMPYGKVLTDIDFRDNKGNIVRLEAVDLLRLVPRYDAPGDMIYPEVLLEEFNRFGFSFRKEHNEFDILLNNNSSQDEVDAKERAYRCQIVNNCLAPTKWEFALTSEDYSDFSTRLKNKENLNQNKILSHSWFYVDSELYYSLLRLKNPRITREIAAIPYDSLSNLSENIFIDFNLLRKPIKYRAKSEVVEFGYKSGRKIEPLDNEQFYKKQFNLILSDTSKTYTTILEEDIATTQFKNEGFYTPATPKVFNLNWMKYLDSIYIDVVDVRGTEAYVQLTITGQWSPYEITLGNVDLALVDEQKLLGFLFGFNTYPKGRRYNPVQSTIVYDADLLPNELKPYLILTDKKTGNWVNNQYKGIEKMYLTYESLERQYLMVHVLSYERIIPVWMAKVKLPKDLREKVRIRKGMYNY